MKKILLIIGIIFLISSCWTKTINKDLWSIPEESNSIKKVETIKNNNINPNFKETYKKLKKLEKLGLSNEEINSLNEYLDSIFLNKIIFSAIEKKDIKECYKLDKNNINACIMSFAIEANNLNKCKQINNTESIIDCENTIIKIKSEESLDPKICDQLNISKYDKDEWKDIIQSCKNDIYIKKAKKELNPKECEKIPNKEKEIKAICIQEVNSEKLYRKPETN